MNKDRFWDEVLSRIEAKTEVLCSEIISNLSDQNIVEHLTQRMIGIYQFFYDHVNNQRFQEQLISSLGNYLHNMRVRNIYLRPIEFVFANGETVLTDHILAAGDIRGFEGPLRGEKRKGHMEIETHFDHATDSLRTNIYDLLAYYEKISGPFDIEHLCRRLGKSPYDLDTEPAMC